MNGIPLQGVLYPWNSTQLTAPPVWGTTVKSHFTAGDAKTQIKALVDCNEPSAAGGKQKGPCVTKAQSWEL